MGPITDIPELYCPIERIVWVKVKVIVLSGLIIRAIKYIWGQSAAEYGDITAIAVLDA